MIRSAEDFRDFVAEEARNEPNPHLLAERVVSKLAGHPEALAIALGVTAPGWVATFIKRPRTHVNKPPTVGDGKPPVPEFNPGRPASHQPRVYIDAEGNRRVSSKTAALVDWYTAKLRVSVHTGSSTSDWKRLADCTVTDLRWMVDARTKLAAENVRSAAQYRKLADALVEHGATTVAELDPAIGKAILTE